MITAYVILSRVKSAGGLLLLRAFAHHLFKWGPPVGPTCLLHLLRTRFRRKLARNAISDLETTERTLNVALEPYTPEVAKADYETKTANYKRLKKIQKNFRWLQRMAVGRPLSTATYTSQCCSIYTNNRYQN